MNDNLKLRYKAHQARCGGVGCLACEIATELYCYAAGKVEALRAELATAKERANKAEAGAATYRRELAALLETEVFGERAAITEDLLASENAGQTLLDRVAQAEATIARLNAENDALLRERGNAIRDHGKALRLWDVARADAATFRQWIEQNLARIHATEAGNHSDNVADCHYWRCRNTVGLLQAASPGAELLAELDTLRERLAAAEATIKQQSREAMASSLEYVRLDKLKIDRVLVAAALLERLRTALRGIQEMAAEDLRTGERPLKTCLYQIEADARAALEGR